ncbi:MAG: hypothetical protein M0Z78_06615 [Betaproteobacteria bacterium]|nr:hypothetical protein [Betaproteobacteria bacterium]
MRSLWPPMEVIANKLQGGTDYPVHFLDGEEFAGTTETGNAEMPQFIRDKVRMRVASRMAQFDALPIAGQIWRFDGNQNNVAPLCVLLDRPQDEYHWQGWLVSPETDYATYQDVLLEPRDEPFDPLASMVQTWNSVTVDIRKGSRILAQLVAGRMDAIREVASGHCDKGGGARPGFVAPLMTQSGATVLAGTRIVHVDDPRRSYQELCRSTARSLQNQEGRASEEGSSVPSRRLWIQVGWSLAASIMLAQTAIIANLMRGEPEKVMPKQATEFRSAPKIHPRYAYLDVNFKPDAREIDIRKLLTRIKAIVVDGPGEFGQYRIRVLLGSDRAALESIEKSGLVDNVSTLN